MVVVVFFLLVTAIGLVGLSALSGGAASGQASNKQAADDSRDPLVLIVDDEPVKELLLGLARHSCD